MSGYFIKTFNNLCMMMLVSCHCGNMGYCGIVSSIVFMFFFFFFIDAEIPLSPFYNWACGIDIKMEEHAQLVQESISQNLNVTQGIKLVKIWLAQRKLDKVRSLVTCLFFCLLFFMYDCFKCVFLLGKG